MKNELGNIMNQEYRNIRVINTVAKIGRHSIDLIYHDLLATRILSYGDTGAVFGFMPACRQDTGMWGTTEVSPQLGLAVSWRCGDLKLFNILPDQPELVVLHYIRIPRSFRDFAGQGVCEIY